MTRFHIFHARDGWRPLSVEISLLFIHIFSSRSLCSFQWNGKLTYKAKTSSRVHYAVRPFFCDVLFSVWVWLKNCDGDDNDGWVSPARAAQRIAQNTHNRPSESRTSFLTINNHPTRRRMASNGMSKEGREEEWNLSRICKAERGNERTNSQFPSSEFD